MMSYSRSAHCQGFGYSLRGILIFLSIVASRHATSTETVNDATVRRGYLSHIGRNNSNTSSPGADSVNKVIKNFQIVSELRAPDELHDETSKQMPLPHCGVVDHADNNSARRSKRYSIWMNRWPKRDITYSILSFPEGLNRNDVKSEIARAFRAWSEYTNLIFTEKETGPVDIEIRFDESLNVENHEIFDGPSKILGYAFSPWSGGDVYFDRSENWVINNTNLSNKPNPINLFQAAVHEFGHALGLLHSDVPTSVMASTYKGYDANCRLDPDDVAGIQALYGSRIDICHDPKVDAAFISYTGEAYLLSGNKFYVLHDNGLSQGQLIIDSWSPVPSECQYISLYEVISRPQPTPSYGQEIRREYYTYNFDGTACIADGVMYFTRYQQPVNHGMDPTLIDKNGSYVVFQGDKVYITQTSQWENLRNWLGC